MEIRTMEQFKAFLREARLKRGLRTWQAAADATGVPLQSVRRAEVGSEAPRMGAVLKLLAGYGVIMDLRYTPPVTEYWGTCPACGAQVGGHMTPDRDRKTWQKGCPTCRRRLTIRGTRSETGGWVVPVVVKTRG